MSEFLKSLRIGKTGIAFIINGKGEVIAFPGMSHILANQESDVRSIHVDELGIERVSAFFREYKKSQKNRFTFERDGKRFIGTLVDFPRAFTGDWKLSIIVPEDDFIGPIKKTRLVVIAISIIVLMIAIGCAVILSHNISKPIFQVARETERIKDFELEGELEAVSYIKEIQTLISAATYEIIKDHFAAQGPFEVWGKGIEAAIQIWDVREAKEEPSLRLPPVVRDLKALPQPVLVTLRLMRGKQIDSKSLTAYLTRLADVGCELSSDQDLELFSAIQIQIAGAYTDGIVPIDGKVVVANKEQKTLIVRFSTLDAIQTEAIYMILKTSSPSAKSE